MPGIGESLREARLNRGLTHEYISQIIKIRPEFLIALEEEDLAALPGNFYAKNFLRRYADFLNLDSGAIVERWVMQENAVAGQPSTAFSSPPATSRPPETRRHWRPNFGLAAMLAVLVVGALALGVRAFLMPPAREASNVVSATATPSAIAVALVPTPTSAPNPARTTAPSSQPTRIAPAPAVAARATATPRAQALPPSATATRRPTRQVAQPRATATPRPKPASAQKPQPTNTPRPKPTNTPRPKPTNTPRPEPTNTPRPTATPEPTNTPTPKPTNTPTPDTSGEVVGTIRTTSTSSVTVKADGRTVFQGEIAPGEVQSFGANANLYIYSNSAQSVLVRVNECIIRTLDSYGCPGCQVAYYNFPRTYTDCR